MEFRSESRRNLLGSRGRPHFFPPSGEALVRIDIGEQIRDPNEVHIQRGIVEGYVDDTKTTSSNGKLPLHPMIVEALLSWRQQSPFNSDTDYVFASPAMLGAKPLNANSAQRDYLRPASIRAGLKPIGFHAMRHSYRTWLDEVGSGAMVQKELMWHSTIAMTMDGYGRGVPAANREANSRLVGQLLNDGTVQ